MPDFMISFPLVHLSVVWFAPWAWLWSHCWRVVAASPEPLCREGLLSHPQCVFSLSGYPLSLINARGVFNGSLWGCFLMLSCLQAAPVFQLFQEKATLRLSITLAALNKWGFENKAENFETSAPEIINAERAMVATRGRGGEGCDMGGKNDDQVRDQIAVIFLSIAALYDEVIVWVKDTLVVVCVWAMIVICTCLLLFSLSFCKWWLECL